MKKLLLIVLLLSMMAAASAQGNYELNSYRNLKEEGSIPSLIKAMSFITSEIEKSVQRDSDIREMVIEAHTNSYTPHFDAIDTLTPELWETDFEFESRKIDVYKELSNEFKKSHDELETALQHRYDVEVAPLIEILSQVSTELNKLRTEKNALKISPLTYNRNMREWPLLITYENPVFALHSIPVRIRFALEASGNSENFRRELFAFSEAIEKGKLESSITWHIKYDPESNKFNIVVQHLQITNPLNQKAYTLNSDFPVTVKSLRVEGNTLKEAIIREASIIHDIHIIPNLKIAPKSSIALNLPENDFMMSAENQSTYRMDQLVDFSEEYPQPIQGLISPTSPLTDDAVKTVITNLFVSPNTVLIPKLIFSIDDTSIAQINGTILEASKRGRTVLSVSTEDGLFYKPFPIDIEYVVGTEGPAGGIIIHDKGDYSNGFRFLEVAPTDAYTFSYSSSVVVEWGDSSEIPEQYKLTKTSLGSGQSNTNIIAQSTRSPTGAAQLCLDYQANGFSDWYLPSLEELMLFPEWITNTGYYWSSSYSSNGKAWCLKFGELGELGLYQYTPNIRPIRQF